MSADIIPFRRTSRPVTAEHFEREVTAADSGPQSRPQSRYVHFSREAWDIIEAVLWERRDRATLDMLCALRRDGLPPKKGSRHV